jgi:hypothetical protein
MENNGSIVNIQNILVYVEKNTLKINIALLNDKVSKDYILKNKEEFIFLLRYKRLDIILSEDLNLMELFEEKNIKISGNVDFFEKHSEMFDNYFSFVSEIDLYEIDLENIKQEIFKNKELFVDVGQLGVFQNVVITNKELINKNKECLEFVDVFLSQINKIRKHFFKLSNLFNK